MSELFKEQVTTEITLEEVFFAVTMAAAVFGVLALAFMDSGSSRRKNVLDNWVGKILASLITAPRDQTNRRNNMPSFAVWEIHLVMRLASSVV